MEAGESEGGGRGNPSTCFPHGINHHSTLTEMIEVSIQTTSRWLQCSGERELNHSSTALLASAALSPPLVHRQPPPPASSVTDDLRRWWPPSKLTRFKNMEQEQHGQEQQHYIMKVTIIMPKNLHSSRNPDLPALRTSPAVRTKCKLRGGNKRWETPTLLCPIVFLLCACKQVRWARRRRRALLECTLCLSEAAKWLLVIGPLRLCRLDITMNNE